MKTYDWDLSVDATVEYDLSAGTNRKITPVSVEPNDPPEVEIRSVDVFVTLGSLKAALANLTGHEKDDDFMKINVIDVLTRMEKDTIKDNILYNHSEDAS